MNHETTQQKLIRLQQLHEQITELQRQEDELAAELATSTERGVRTAMGRALGVSLEALRQRYGSIPSVANVVPASEK